MLEKLSCSDTITLIMKHFLVIIDGPMGSGKTTVGKILHSKLKRTAVLSTDKIKFFLSDFERGERDNSITANVLLQMCREYIRQGINVLLAQGFWKKEFIEPYITFAKENDLALFVYQLEASREVLLERIKNRPTPTIAKVPVPQKRIEENFSVWSENKYEAQKVFNTETLPPEAIANLILEDLKEWQ